MTAVLKVQGPDGTQHWNDNQAALGYCALNSTTQSRNDIQPRVDRERGLVLVLDGRIDNRDALQADFRKRSVCAARGTDSECLLLAYSLWGQDCLERLEGDFAFVIWDQRKQCVFAARDPLGHKSLFYYCQDDRLVIASAVHAILELPFVPKKLNLGTVAEFVSAQWYTADETFWLGIQRLPAAHKLCARSKTLQLGRYWQPDCARRVSFASDGDAAEYYRTLLENSVHRSCQSDAPLAFEVSGGLDSSAIFSIADRMQQRGQLPAPGIKAYFLNFPPGSAAYERNYLDAMRAYTETPIEDIEPVYENLDWYRQQIARYKTFPGYPNTPMHIGLLNSAKQQGCRALIHGGGGDEWLSGTRSYYRSLLLSLKWTSLIADLKQDVGEFGAATVSMWAIKAMLRRLTSSRQRDTIKRLFGINHFQQPRCISRDLHEELIEKQHRYLQFQKSLQTKFVGQADLYQTLYAPFREWNAEIFGRFFASFGFEVRTPLETLQLVEFAFATDERLRRRTFWNKWLHRYAMRGRLPDEILLRRGKAEFGITSEKTLCSWDVYSFVRASGASMTWLLPDVIRKAYDRYAVPSQSGGVAVPNALHLTLWGVINCQAIFDCHE